MMEYDERIKSNRLRRAARRQGLQLMRSRARDPRAIGYGTYMLIDAEKNKIVAMGLPHGYGMTLFEVELWLLGEELEQDPAVAG